jgi:hypothetical protein
MYNKSKKRKSSSGTKSSNKSKQKKKMVDFDGDTQQHAFAQHKIKSHTITHAIKKKTYKIPMVILFT